MAAFLYFSAPVFVILGSYAAPAFVWGVFTGLAVLVFGVFALLILIYVKESLPNDGRPPVAGSVFNMLIHFNHLYDYFTSIARKRKTFRFITPGHSEVYTTDPVNVEYMLKTNFANYVKVWIFFCAF